MITKINKGLLNLIIMIQAYKKLLVSEKMFYEDCHNLEYIKKDWFRQTEEYYYNINQNILDVYGLKKNRVCFEEIYCFKITKEMMEQEF